MNNLMDARPWPQGGMKRSMVTRALQTIAGGGSQQGTSHPKKSTARSSQKAQDKKRKQAMDEAGNKIAAGMVSGVSQAALFHPWDRALYLAQTNQRLWGPRTPENTVQNAEYCVVPSER